MLFNSPHHAPSFLIINYVKFFTSAGCFLPWQQGIVAELTTWSSARPKKLACLKVLGEKEEEEKEGESKEGEMGRVEGRETMESHS